MTDATSVLVLSGMGVPPYSIRGAQEQLQPIAAAVQLHRTVNGDLVDFSEDQFQKYALTISCTDQQPPALAGQWPGRQTLTVDCISELAVPLDTDLESTDDPETIDGRAVVEGSWRIESDFGFYRPQMSMLVTGFTATKDEYGATISWQLTLEEV
jgi:hypothetical protein